MPGTLILQLPPERVRAVNPGSPLNAVIPLPIDVNEGQPLGVFIDRGKEIPPSFSSLVKWQLPDKMTLSEVCKEGIKIDPGDYPILVSLQRGVLIPSEHSLKISKTYEVTGNVDKRTGDIDTPSSVIVHGQVVLGATIVSGGDVEVRGLVEEAVIRAGGSIIAKGGVTGGDATKFAAGKDIYCQFVQHASLEAVGNIIVDGSIMNSNIICGKKLSIRKSGFLVGGKVRVGEAVEVSRIGSEAAVPTEIELGVNPFQKQQIDHVREKIAGLEHEIETLTTAVRYAGHSMEGRVQFDESDLLTSLFRAAEYISIEGERLSDEQREDLDKFGGGIMSLLKKTEEYEVEKRNAEGLGEGGGSRLFEHARLTVSKIAHPGTVIKIGDALLRLDREYENAAFYHKKPSGEQKLSEVGISYL